MVELVPKCTIRERNSGYFSGIYNILWLPLSCIQTKQAARKAACLYRLRPCPKPGLASDPGALRCHPGFEGVDRRGLFKRQADVVETVQQAMLLEGVHLERENLAIG